MSRRELALIKKFHGHLGPYVILGYRAGKLAKKLLKEICEVKIWTRKKPPDSCFIDGIQLATGCTVGRGELKVIEEKTLKKVFFVNKNKKLTFGIRSDILPLTLQKVKRLANSKLFDLKK